VGTSASSARAAGIGLVDLDDPGVVAGLADVATLDTTEVLRERPLFERRALDER